jgi:hypothetical protein
MPENTQVGTYPVSGVRSEQIFTLYDAGQPVYVRELAKRFGMQVDPFHNWFRLMNREEAIPANGEWYAYEENRYHETILTTGNVADPGVGNDATIQLDASCFDTNGNYYGRVGETITMPTTGVQARIHAITGAFPAVFFTLKPISATSNIGAIASGTTLAITNGGYAAGTGQPNSATVGATKREFKLQIFKETVAFEGPEVAKQLWYQAFDENGQPVGFVTSMTNQALYRLNLKINGAFLTGQANTNATLTETTRHNATNTIRYTEGLLPTITRLGATSTIPAGTFAMDDLDDFGIYMRTQGVESGVAMFAVGAKLRNDIENECKDFLDTNGTDFTMAVKSVLSNGKDWEKAVSLGFSQINKGGFSYLLKTIDDFSNPKTFGATGYDYDQHGIIIPLTSFSDPVSGKKLDNICVKYADNNGYNRRMEMWREAGAGGNPNTYVHQYDDMAINMRAHLGLQLLKMNQATYVKTT